MAEAFEPITTQEAFEAAVADRLAPYADCNEYTNNDELRNTLKFSQLSRYANKQATTRQQPKRK